MYISALTTQIFNQKISNWILFSKNNANIKSNFCEVYTLGKQHKVHSKKPLIDIINKPRVYLHIELFDRENILSDIGSYRYGVILIDEAI